jgi:regulator of protease activity HflC (stomatin/prohibitin superfamily)
MKYVSRVLANRFFPLAIGLVLWLIGRLVNADWLWYGLIGWALLAYYGMYVVGLWLAAPLLVPTESNPESRGKLRSLLFRHVAGVKPAMLVVREGRILPGPDGKPRDKASGQGLVLVDSTSVVLIATDLQPVRLAGPGIHFLGQFQKIGAVVDLRRQLRQRQIDAQTRDGIWITFKMNARFQIDKARLQLEEPLIAKQTWPEPFAWSQGPIWTALDRTRTGDDDHPWVRWDDIVLNEAVKHVQTRIAEFTFDELTEPRNPLVNRREDIRKNVEDDVRASIAGTGLSLVGVTIDQFKPRDDEVLSQRIESWQAEWTRRRKIIEAEGEAEARRKLELARAQAQMDTMTRMIEALDASRKAGANNADLIALRFLEVVEGLAKDPETQRTLESVRRRLLGDETSGGKRTSS